MLVVVRRGSRVVCGRWRCGGLARRERRVHGCCARGRLRRRAHGSTRVATAERDHQRPKRRQRHETIAFCHDCPNQELTPSIRYRHPEAPNAGTLAASYAQRRAILPPACGLALVSCAGCAGPARRRARALARGRKLQRIDDLSCEIDRRALKSRERDQRALYLGRSELPERADPNDVKRKVSSHDALAR